MEKKIEEFTKYILDSLQEHANVKLTGIDLDYSKLNLGFKRLGIKTPLVRKLANEFFRELKTKGITQIDEILEYCKYLQQMRISELRTIAVQWSFKVKNQFKPKHFDVFKNWLKNYVTGWGSTDNLCVQSLGYIVHMYPELVNKVKRWTSSPNQWVRRASAVSLIYGLRRGLFLNDAFEIANELFHDSEMYVLKGYGWMLKEASNTYQQEVFDYVMERKDSMPRLSLRYAIEKMPEKMRKKAMQ